MAVYTSPVKRIRHLAQHLPRGLVVIPADRLLLAQGFSSFARNVCDLRIGTSSFKYNSIPHNQISYGPGLQRFGGQIPHIRQRTSRAKKRQIRHLQGLKFDELHSAKSSPLLVRTLLRPFGNFLKNLFHLFRPGKLPSLQSTPETENLPHLFPIMKSNIRIVQVPTADSSGTTLILHFDNKRYVFGNVSEGTQRSFVETGVKMLKMTDVFITGRTDWKTTGGLLGMMLTLADSLASHVATMASVNAMKAERRKLRKATNGTSKSGASAGSELMDTSKSDPSLNETNPVVLNLFGGRNLVHTIATARRFIFRKGLPVRPHELHLASQYTQEEIDSDTLTPTWSDDNIKVWSMSLSPSNADVEGLRSSVNGSPISKKRKSDVLDEGEELKISQQESQYSQIRDAVVSEMFESTWNFDDLFEVKLHDAVLPASLFTRTNEGKIQRYEGPLPANVQFTDQEKLQVPNVPVLVRKPWPGALIKTLPPTTPAHESMCYIVKNHPQRGKFLPDKAVALGVRPGQKFSFLSKGQSVEAEDGSIVTPEMVLAPGREGGGFAMLEIPSHEYVDSLISRPEWSSKSLMNGVGVVIWILGPGVAEISRLRDFWKKHSHLEHIVSSVDCCSNELTYRKVAEQTMRLHQVDPIRFPPLVFNNDDLPQPSTRATGVAADITPLFSPARVGKMIQLEPRIEILDYSIRPPINPAEIYAATDPRVLDLGAQARTMIEAATSETVADKMQGKVPSRDAEIIALGTGSALPSKYRNVSATLLRVPGYGSYLFDCGENTLGQLRRAYTDPELKEILRDLKMIWISHLHADHHLGTVSVIKAWYEEVWGREIATSMNVGPNSTREEILQALREKRLFVVSDSAMTDWLAEYAMAEDFGYYKIVPLAIDKAWGRGMYFLPANTFWNDVPVGFHGDQKL